MAEGHPGSCEQATIGSVCHCDCSGVRHSVALTGGIPAPASAKKGGKGTPTEGYKPPTPQITPTSTPVLTVDNAEPAPAADDASPAAPPARTTPSFDERAAAARTGAAAREAAPVSLNRRDELTETEAEGLDAYIDESYQPINHMLRGGDASRLPGWYTNEQQVAEWTAGVDEAMARSPLAEETQTWRGIQSGPVIFGDAFDGDLTGAEWTEDAYVSTTTDPAISEGFANDAADPRESAVMRIVTPAGVNAVELSGEEYESELLLDRGLRMRVVADRGRDSEGRRLLDVEVLPRTNG